MLSSVITIFFLLNSVAAACNEDKRVSYLRGLGSTCQNAIESILSRSISPLSDANFDLACTSTCMGAYRSWLLRECDDTHTANVVVLACTTSDTNRLSWCRNFFPDIERMRVFESTTSCAANLLPNATTCSRDCEIPLRSLIRSFGCCFQSIYNSIDSIESLQYLLEPSQATVLQLFQTSDILTQCNVGPVPEACQGNPFSNTDAGTSTALPDSGTASKSVDGDQVITVANSAMNVGWNGLALTLSLFLVAISYS